jgi:hypothetical protein
MQALDVQQSIKEGESKDRAAERKAVVGQQVEDDDERILIGRCIAAFESCWRSRAGRRLVSRTSKVCRSRKRKDAGESGGVARPEADGSEQGSAVRKRSKMEKSLTY